jgi:XRE family transcriptional regulator, aerobic/anaerobic benzoate catabolism transcriptional regulator
MQNNAVTRDEYLAELGNRARSLRARRGLTRKTLAQTSGVSERHLANLESGTGNASVLVLRDVASSLGCELAELLGDASAQSPEWLMIRDLLRDKDDETLKRAHRALAQMFSPRAASHDRERRIALIGLRGAGKSSLGRALAEKRGATFVEINREIERLAGCSVAEVHALMGPEAYRRYERRALDEITSDGGHVVIATPGGIVSDTTTFNLLLSRCFTVWLHASPEEHMARVVAQGVRRPMQGNREAMEDLKRILTARTTFYRKADVEVSTTGLSFDEALHALERACPGATV